MEQNPEDAYNIQVNSHALDSLASINTSFNPASRNQIRVTTKSNSRSKKRLQLSPMFKAVMDKTIEQQKAGRLSSNQSSNRRLSVERRPSPVSLNTSSYLQKTGNLPNLKPFYDEHSLPVRQDTVTSKRSQKSSRRSNHNQAKPKNEAGVNSFAFFSILEKTKEKMPSIDLSFVCSKDTTIEQFKRKIAKNFQIYHTLNSVAGNNEENSLFVIEKYMEEIFYEFNKTFQGSANSKTWHSKEFVHYLENKKMALRFFVSRFREILLKNNPKLSEVFYHIIENQSYYYNEKLSQRKSLYKKLKHELDKRNLMETEKKKSEGHKLSEVIDTMSTYIQDLKESNASLKIELIQHRNNKSNVHNNERELMKIISDKNEKLLLMKKYLQDSYSKIKDADNSFKLLQEKILFYLKNDKMSRQEYEHLKIQSIVKDEEVIQRIDQWIDSEEFKREMENYELGINKIEVNESSEESFRSKESEKKESFDPEAGYKLRVQQLRGMSLLKYKSHSVACFKDEFKVKKSQSKLLFYLDFSNLVKRCQVQTGTEDLVELADFSCQTKVSFANSKFSQFIVDQKDLIRVHNKIEFAQSLTSSLSKNEDLLYIRNPRMIKIVEGRGDELMKDGSSAQEATESILREVIENFAFEAKQRILLKDKKNQLKEKVDFYENACLNFKSEISRLDEAILE